MRKQIQYRSRRAEAHLALKLPVRPASASETVTRLRVRKSYSDSESHSYHHDMTSRSLHTAYYLFRTKHIPVSKFLILPVTNWQVVRANLDSLRPGVARTCWYRAVTPSRATVTQLNTCSGQRQPTYWRSE